MKNRASVSIQKVDTPINTNADVDQLMIVAKSDNNLYVNDQNGNSKSLVYEAPNNNSNYVRKNNSWELLPNSVSTKRLLFKVINLEGNPSRYQLYIEFSANDNFTSPVLFNSNSNISLFKVFTGQQLINFPASGVDSTYSDQIITFDITGLDIVNKNVRFRWYNGTNYSEYSFGSIDGSLQVFTSSKAVQDASTTTKGIIQLATSSEVTTGTNNNKGLTPLLLKESFNSIIGDLETILANIVGKTL